MGLKQVSFEVVPISEGPLSNCRMAHLLQTCTLHSAIHERLCSGETKCHLTYARVCTNTQSTNSKGATLSRVRFVGSSPSYPGLQPAALWRCYYGLLICLALWPTRAKLFVALPRRAVPCSSWAISIFAAWYDAVHSGEGPINVLEWARFKIAKARFTKSRVSLDGVY